MVPSEASISTRKDPRTLMPQLVRDLRYCSHCEAGVEIGESMSLCRDVSPPLGRMGMEIESDDAHQGMGMSYQWPPFTL